MSSPRQRNDRSGPHWKPHGRGPERRKAEPGEWLWGWHAVAAALANPLRSPERLLATPDQAKRLEGMARGVRIEIADMNEIARAIGHQGAVHQGVALAAPGLDALSIEDIAEPAEGVILVLDQVTDPQNVGAIFRSAAAFGAKGVVLQDRHAPPFTGAMAKAAAGALEKVPAARVVNLSRALDQLTDFGWRTVGLAGGAEASLDQVLDGGPVALVLGSEGEGLRRLVGEHCDLLARIPMPGGFESLNVSSAAAVALYEASRTARARAAGE